MGFEEGGIIVYLLISFFLSLAIFYLYRNYELYYNKNYGSTPKILVIAIMIVGIIIELVNHIV